MSIKTVCVTFLFHNAESGDIKASVAMLSFIFSSAAKHNVDCESLSSELQQLGLPKGESPPEVHCIPFLDHVYKLKHKTIGKI